MIILELWKQQSAKFFCICTQTFGVKGSWKEHWFTPAEFGSVRQFLRDNDEKDIYFCPHGFNRRARQETEAVLPNLLWADLDFADPRSGGEEWKGLKPTILIESSPGRFVGIWITKFPMDKELNRRLSYHIKADPAGWDITQVLRFPGTRNYKYASQPKVRTLWDDGPIYSKARLEKWLPPEESVEKIAGELSPAEVFEQYASVLPKWVRRELVAKKITGKVDRSEMLWKLENACVEAGMNLEEAFAVIKRSIWNKFAGRRNENGQLKREIEKIVQHQFAEKPRGKEKLHRKSDQEISDEDRENEPRSFLNPVRMSDVKEEKMDFVWEPYLARGQVTMLEGDPGLGKSYFAMMVAASITTGKPLITYMKGKPSAKGPVIYFDMENATATVVKPRLVHNGFTDEDLYDYHVVEKAFSIDDEDIMEEVYELMEEVKPVLVVFDTLNMYIGKADTHKGSEVAQAFGNFMNLASHFNCAVMVLRHLVKSKGGSAITRGQGSMTFAGSARCVLSIGVDPADTETRAVAITKLNYAKAPPALTFRIEERPKGKSEFVWGGFVNLSSQEIMDAASEARAEGKQGTGVQDAMEFLEGQITGVSVDVEKLYRMAEKRSIAKTMIDRCAAKMNIKIKEKDGTVYWRLPRHKKTEEEDD